LSQKHPEFHTIRDIVKTAKTRESVLGEKRKIENRLRLETTDISIVDCEICRYDMKELLGLIWYDDDGQMNESEESNKLLELFVSLTF
jgi:hypothetical protein